MRACEIINEIDYADATQDLTAPDDYLIARSQIVGDVDHTDVYLYTGGSSRLFFFVRDGAIQGYVLLDGDKLRGG